MEKFERFMFENDIKRPNALLVSVILPGSDDELSILELEELTKTAGANVVGVATQNRQRINAATFVGSGKLAEIKCAISDMDIQLVVFDSILSPTQLKNIEGFLNCLVLDRTGIILQIFAMRARSLEGKLQVELAQLKYMLPRLRSDVDELSKLAGGIGTRGPGESKLESDRRHIMRRIEFLKSKMEVVSKNRTLLRDKRKSGEFPLVSIAGYTNAGKSTLLNYLTDSDVYAKDMLFATLDATTRKLKLKNGQSVLISDTVGFIRNLPHELIYSFKSTFEEIVYSDLVLLVCDASSADFSGMLDVVKATLNDIGYNGPIIMVYNKIDLIDFNNITFFPSKDSVYISCKTGEGVDKLLKLIEDTICQTKEYDLILQYSKMAVYNELKSEGKILSENFDEDKIVLRCNLNALESKHYYDYIILD